MEWANAHTRHKNHSSYRQQAIKFSHTKVWQVWHLCLHSESPQVEKSDKIIQALRGEKQKTATLSVWLNPLEADDRGIEYQNSVEENENGRLRAQQAIKSKTYHCGRLALKVSPKAQ